MLKDDFDKISSMIVDYLQVIACLREIVVTTGTTRQVEEMEGMFEALGLRAEAVRPERFARQNSPTPEGAECKVLNLEQFRTDQR